MIQKEKESENKTEKEGRKTGRQEGGQEGKTSRLSRQALLITLFCDTEYIIQSFILWKFTSGWVLRYLVYT